MKKNISIIILLIITIFLLIYQQKTNTIKKELRNFAVEDINSINKVFLADRHGNQVTLFKINNKWLVENKYPARQDGIEIMLKTMKKIRIRQPISENMHNTVIKNLATKGVKVEIFTDNLDQAEKTYYVGTEAADLLGSFMIMENSNKAFITHIPGFNGFLAPRYNIEGTKISIDLWRDRSLINFKTDEIKSISIKYHEDTTINTNLYLEYKNSQYYIYNSDKKNKKIIGKANSTKVNTYLQRFVKANCEGFMNSFSKKDSIINSTPFHTITILSKNKVAKTIKTYHKSPKRAEYQNINGEPLKWDTDRMYAYDGRDFTLVQFYTFKDLLLQPKDLY